MRLFTLLRISKGEQGVFGVLKDGNMPVCVTVENDACIFPDGEYICKRVHSPKFGETFEVSVYGRSNILFHIGNWEDDSTGCIILGRRFDMVQDVKRGRVKEGVAESKAAFTRFMEATDKLSAFSLRVRTVANSGS